MLRSDKCHTSWVKNLILLWYVATIFFLCHFILKLCNIKVKHTVNYPKSVFGFSHFTNEGFRQILTPRKMTPLLGYYWHDSWKYCITNLFNASVPLVPLKIFWRFAPVSYCSKAHESVCKFLFFSRFFSILNSLQKCCVHLQWLSWPHCNIINLFVLLSKYWVSNLDRHANIVSCLGFIQFMENLESHGI